MSLLDQFLQSCSAIADSVIGQDEFALDSGLLLKGVWSSVARRSAAEDGGLQFIADATIIVQLPQGIGFDDLNGKVGTGKDGRYRIDYPDIGEAFTTLFLVHATEAIR